MAVWMQPTYATVWEVTSHDEKSATVRLSTSRKNQNGEYVNSNWFARFIGKALTNVDKLSAKDRIQLQKGFVEISSVKQSDGGYKNYTNLLVFEWDFSDNVRSPQSSSTSLPEDEEPPQEPEKPDTEEYPF